MIRDLSVKCPCCGARLDVDARTGRVLRHEKPGARPADPFAKGLERAQRPVDSDAAFRAAAETLDARRREAEDAFGKRADQIRREADEGKDVRPPHPFDND